MDFDGSLHSTAGANVLDKKTTLIRCATIAYEMLEARGFCKIEGDILTYESIENSMINHKPLLCGSCSSRGRNNSYLYFFSEVKLGVKIVRDLLDEIGPASDNMHLILVSTFGATSSKPMNKMDNVEFLTYKQLTFNVTKHQLVPKHTYMNKCQSEAILNYFSAQKRDFPVLLSSDPVATFCNFIVDDIVKINRPSMGGVTEGGITYRVVVNPNT